MLQNWISKCRKVRILRWYLPAFLLGSGLASGTGMRAPDSPVDLRVRVTSVQAAIQKKQFGSESPLQDLHFLHPKGVDQNTTIAQWYNWPNWNNWVNWNNWNNWNNWLNWVNF